MNMLRLLLRKAKGRPLRKPLRKKRLVGSVVREKVAFQKQRLPQAEPTAAESMAVSVMMRLHISCMEVKGCTVTALNFKTDRASDMVVMILASLGTERRM